MNPSDLTSVSVRKLLLLCINLNEFSFDDGARVTPPVYPLLVPTPDSGSAVPLAPQ